MRIPRIRPPTVLLALLLLLPAVQAHDAAVSAAVSAPDCAQVVRTASTTPAVSSTTAVACGDADPPDCSIVFVTVHEDPLWLEPSLKPGCIQEWGWFVLGLLGQ